MTDRAAEVARFIMTRKRESDQRQIVFDLWRCFRDIEPGELMRGISIALELYEADEVPHAFAK